MALKPLKDRVVAVVEKPLEKTKSGILLGEARKNLHMRWLSQLDQR